MIFATFLRAAASPAATRGVSLPSFAGLMASGSGIARSKCMPKPTASALTSKQELVMREREREKKRERERER